MEEQEIVMPPEEWRSIYDRDLVTETKENLDRLDESRNENL